MTSGAAAVALAAELTPLRGLVGWRPLDERVAEVLAALGGVEGVDEFAVQRLRRWASRWPRLHPALQAFYAYAAPRDLRASSALWWVLDHDHSAELPRNLVVSVYCAWRETEGEPTIELMPQFRGKERRR